MRAAPLLVTFLFLISLPLLAAPAAPTTGTHPADKRPGSLGFSFSELTGVGFNYRYLDSQGGWQIAGMASSHLGEGEDWYFSGGLAKHSVLFSYVVNDWVYSQFYWLGGVAWRTQKIVTEEWDWVSTSEDPWNGHSVTWTTTEWKNILTFGPALGLEVGLLEHISLNVEAGYKVGYDFSETTPQDSLTAVPGFSAMFLFRY